MTHVGSIPTFAIIQLLGVTATRQVLILKPTVQILRELRMGYWYNGDYSGLLIRQIRVRIPGSPLTPHLLTRTGSQTFNLAVRVQVPLG